MVDAFYFNRNDISVGSFFEYSYDNLENFNLVAGIRIDSIIDWELLLLLDCT